ncbi:L-threonine ammonia-lyase [Alphaproteobacteria bacterium SO-S41]|nr:L-threonine ammonia-lyase [Alphaproteobacteria bacterium SO-S41]
MAVTIEDIRAAQRLIEGRVSRTPFNRARTLSDITGAEVFLKFENLQFTASFKERGALTKLSSLTEEERKRGVIAMSAGNHAQGVAYHAAKLGIPATIVMPLGTPFVKISQTKGHGARVIVDGDGLDGARSLAYALAAEENLVFVHPYDDDAIIAGQGTLGLELLEEVPDLDAIIVPIGGGGLISGVATAAKALKPSIKIYGVETELYPAMHNAFNKVNEEERGGGQTIAEGIAVRVMGERCLPIVKALATDVILVEEEMIEHSIALLLNIEKTVVEGAGAAGLAALLTRPELFKGKKVALILCGGNIDPRLLSNVILRELSREGRILNFAVEIEDRPGVLAKIATLVGEAGGNILEVFHNRMLTHMPAKIAELRISAEARDPDHARDVIAHVRHAGFKVREIGAGGV